MPNLRAAIVGVGKTRKEGGATGFAMGDKHASGYLAAEGCDLVAVADVRRENAEAFAQRHPDVSLNLYDSHRAMLQAEKPDMVSVCVWIDLHRPIVLDAIAAGVKAIHCEKPMASTFGEARSMVEAADAAGIQLTFGHQRRFGAPFREAKRRLDAGEIGQLVKLEAACSNLLDWGTHWLDMMFFYNDQTPAEWVLGQIDVKAERRIFGVPVETQGLAHIRFANEVQGLLATGESSMALIGASNRLVGTKGVIEVGVGQGPGAGPNLRILREDRAGWEAIPTEENLHGNAAFGRAVCEAVECARTGKRSTLDCHNALQATEIIFAAYESSRRRGRVDLPLDIEDSPFLSMLAERKTETH